MTVNEEQTHLHTILARAMSFDTDPTGLFAAIRFAAQQTGDDHPDAIKIIEQMTLAIAKIP